jgi:hypothetical protein
MDLSITKFSSARRGRSSKNFWLISASFRRYRGHAAQRVISGDNYIRGVPAASISKERLSDVLVALLGFSAARRLQGRRFKPQIETEQIG